MLNDRPECYCGRQIVKLLIRIDSSVKVHFFRFIAMFPSAVKMASSGEFLSIDYAKIVVAVSIRTGQIYQLLHVIV